MHARNEAVERALRAAGIDSEIRFLTADAPTAQVAADHLGVEVGAIANSLVFAIPPASGTAEGDDTPVLIMTSGAHRVDTDFVAQQLGVDRLKRATPALVKQATGQIIGGVAPAGHPQPIRTLIDRALAAHPVLWTAGGTPESMVDMTYEQLLTLTDGKEIDVERTN